ncbi:MAG: DJ-1/PfpI family protein [Methylovulum sp.]|jgi:transcriptional regulator GlxA family with amidase domain|nr:DJ-1/PfpI family protein [Methylovulum sp.]MCF7998001.1 DJ-1/PfpI family protein [Methylovulum sp.]
MLFLRLFFITCFALLCSTAQALTPAQIASVTAFMSKQPNPNVNTNGIGIYVYDGINSLDALGPYRVFKTAGLNAFLIAQKKGMITTNDKLKIEVDKSIDEVSKLDILLIPGGAYETSLQTQDPVILDWIRQIDATTVYTTSVCTGSWILGATGLLEGKNATSNWYRAKEMMEKYGAIFKEERWVKDGKYWTSAGVSAGMDMALAIVLDLFGEEYTQAVMLDLEYNPQPPVKGGSVKKSPVKVRQYMRWMYDYFLLPFVKSTPTPVTTDDTHGCVAPEQWMPSMGHCM